MTYATLVPYGYDYKLIRSSFFSDKSKAIEYANKMSGIVAIQNISENKRQWIRFKRFFNYNSGAYDAMLKST